MNKVVVFLFGLICFSSQSFGATAPKPYVPDEPVTIVKKKPIIASVKQPITVIKRTAKTPVKTVAIKTTKPVPVTKLAKVKSAKSKAVKTTVAKIDVQKASVRKTKAPTKIALNSTQRLNKYSRTPTKSRQLAQQVTVKSARIASRSAATIHAAPTSVPTKVINMPLTSGSPLLDSSSALVMNANSGRMLFGKNAARRTPIASITKLMTAMVVLDAHLSMEQPITISDNDVDRVKKSSSRLEVGTTLSRYDTMWLALMSSENRAAHSLARTYPGGTGAFVKAMNRKARSLGMNHSIFYDPTGLNKDNTSTAADLALMVQAAYRYPQIRQFTTSTEHDIISASGRQLHYQNSNALVREGVWEIELSKTGYIKEAGRCLVMVAEVQSKPMVMVFLDAGATSGRISDARNLKTWLERQPTNQLG
jgi:serine-type D-Ala-D-Ala endopeptidase (penicillin-binding protein 7)